MKFSISFLAVLLFSSGFSVASAAKSADLTRDMLMKDCPIPEHRDFPLSTTLNPCDDFHKYVCDGVESAFQLPANRSAWIFAIYDQREKLLFAKKNFFKFLEQGYKPKTKRAGQLRNFYLGCMNADARKIEEKSFVEAEMKAMAKIKTKKDLAELIAKRVTLPRYSLIGWDSNPNLDDPNIYDVMVSASAMTLPEKSFYEDQTAVADLEDLATGFFEAVGADNPKQRAKWAVEFEQGFAKVAPIPAEMRRRATERNYRERSELVSLYPGLPIASLYTKLPKATLIRDAKPEVMHYVSDSLLNEPLEKIKSVILFHDLRGYMDDAYPKFFERLFAFEHKRLGGPEKRPERQERCTEAVMGNFGMELDAELLPILFPNFPADRVEKNAERVRAAIIEGLRSNTWLSDTARAEAIHKIQVATLQLVKPKRDEDWDFLPVKAYSTTKPIANELNVAQAGIDKMIREVGERRRRERWIAPPLMVNAFYSPPDNRFVLPLGILQYPFFDASMSDREIIGSLGMVVGHELGHAIDDQGSKYDAEGRVRTWKSKGDQDHFAARTQKFIDLYKGFGHDGNLTLGENIGDHEGVTFSFAAAFPKTDPAPSADEVKKYFVSYGRLWCGVIRPEAEKVQLKTNPHSLGWARINGQVMQSDAFQTTYACKAGDKMFVAPADRIRVW